MVLALFLLHAPDSSADAVSANDIQELAFTATWLKLLHYERSIASPTGWTSAIHKGDFFLSQRGRSDPVAELEALVRSLSSVLPIDDNHPRCRFPARTRWVEKQLGLTWPFDPVANCPSFSLWAKHGRVTSISLVFATGYLGNPASYYGHTLLKFNKQGDAEDSSDLLDLALNYGAIVEGDDDPVSYIFKGVFGGYDAGFSHVDFYFHNHNYGENELRDLWEYRLDLPKPAVELIVAHSWEVLGKRYTYYFFRRNCAYRMTELLQLVEGIEILPEKAPWTIPQALIQRLNQVEVLGKPLVKDVRYHPSRQSRFYARYGDLIPAERKVLSDLVLRRGKLNDSKFTTLSTASRQRVLDALLDYSKFIDASENPEDQKDSPMYVEALGERLRLPPGIQDLPPKKADPPHQGRPPGWAQVNWASNSHLGDLMILRLRPAYYDSLDTGSGHVANAALSMGELQFAVHDGNVHVYKLDAVAIESVQAGISRLPGDRGVAWKLRVGAEQDSAACIDCLTIRVQGDYGLGHRWSPSLFTAAYIGGAVQGQSKETGSGFGRVSGDAILRWDALFSARLSMEHRYVPGGRKPHYWVSRAEARWLLSERSDFRLRYERDVAQTVLIGLGVYW